MLKLNFENFLGRFSQTPTLGVGYSAPPLYRPQSFICDEVPSVCVLGFSLTFIDDDDEFDCPNTSRGMPAAPADVKRTTV